MSGKEGPLISVVVTVYNTGECLAPCLDSIAAQTFSDFELICIDDGSTDHSPDVLRKYVDRFPSFRIVRQKNAGPAAARNRGIAEAHGAYLLILDSDDVFEPSFFMSMVNRALSTNAEIIACRSDEFDHDTGKRRPTDWAIRNELLPDEATGQNGRPFSAAETKGCPFSAFMGWPWDKLYRTDLISRNNLRFPDLPNAEDFPFVYLALIRAQSIAVVDEVLIHHRTKRAGSTSNSRLASPLSFYEGIDLLARELQQDEVTWSDLRWGFLNWAVNYTCWNIESLPAESPQRAALINALLKGDMPSLELDEHPRAYFSLHADVDWCLKRLEKEHESGHVARKSVWEYLWVACYRMSHFGPAKLAKQIAAMVRDR